MNYAMIHFYLMLLTLTMGNELGELQFDEKNGLIKINKKEVIVNGLVYKCNVTTYCKKPSLDCGVLTIRRTNLVNGFCRELNYGLIGTGLINQHLVSKTRNCDTDVVGGYFKSNQWLMGVRHSTIDFTLPGVKSDYFEARCRSDFDCYYYSGSSRQTGSLSCYNGELTWSVRDSSGNSGSQEYNSDDKIYPGYCGGECGSESEKSFFNTPGGAVVITIVVVAGLITTYGMWRAAKCGESTADQKMSVILN